MGYQNEGARRVVCDIETAPIIDVSDFLDTSDISAPANYKDPEKIAAYIAEKAQEVVSRAALDLDLCRVVALGWMVEGDDAAQVLTCQSEEAEISTLKYFWRVLDERTTVGYNQVGFDLPILMRRSLYLGVPYPVLNLDKFRTSHIDLQQKLSLNGTKAYRSLNWYCKRFNLDVPADASGGKDIGQLVATEQWDQVEAHCRADVLKTAALACRLGVMQPAAVTDLVF